MYPGVISPLGAIEFWQRGVPIILSLLLMLGLLTPLVAVLALLHHVSTWMLGHTLTIPAGALICLDAAALVLLGPGAYSLDAYRFGRRLIVLPPPR